MHSTGVLSRSGNTFWPARRARDLILSVCVTNFERKMAPKFRLDRTVRWLIETFQTRLLPPTIQNPFLPPPPSFRHSLAECFAFDLDFVKFIRALGVE